MKKLIKDTLFYRADHPDGCLFPKGSYADPRDGWVASPSEIQPLAETPFECTSLVAFQELLNSERASAATLRAQHEAIIASLRAQIAALTGSPVQTPDTGA